MAQVHRFLCFACAGCILLAVLLWHHFVFQKWANYSPVSTPYYQPRLIKPYDANAGRFNGPPSESNTPEARQKWCAEQYPVSDAKYITVDSLEWLEPFQLAVYSENDNVSMMLSEGHFFRQPTIEAALLFYADKDNAIKQHIIDIGANIGLFTIPALFLGYNVIAFEPMERNYAFLRHNACINNLTSRLRAFPYGIGHQDENCWIISRAINLGNGFSACTNADRDFYINHRSDESIGFRIQGQPRFVKLDDYVDPNQNYSLLKVTVNGFEVSSMSRFSIGQLFSSQHLRPPVVIGELYYKNLGLNCYVGDGTYITNMLNREYVATKVKGSTYMADIASVCTAPPGDLVWVDMAHWEQYRFKEDGVAGVVQ